MFLGANQDSYAAGGAMGMHAGNVSNFHPDARRRRRHVRRPQPHGSAWRGKTRAARRRDRDDFWGGHKEAEER